MALSDGKFLRGVLGTFVFRKVNNKQVVSVRVRSGSMKQSLNTKKASHTFGMAASLGAQIRKSLTVQLNSFYDSAMNTRLTGEVVNELKKCRDPKTSLYIFYQDSFKGLSGFEFNAKSKLKTWMAEKPVLLFDNGLLTVHFPDLKIPNDLNFPKDAFRVEIKICISLFRLKDGLQLISPMVQTLEITKNVSSQPAHNFNFNIPDGCLCIQSIFLDYSKAQSNGWKSINSKQLNPGLICGALVTPGVYPLHDDHLWTDMIKFD